MPTGLKYYPATSSQSLYDVCLATYGDYAYLSKLMRDNGIASMSYRPYNGQRFQYDPELVVNQSVEAQGYKFTTAADKAVDNFEVLIAEDSDPNETDPAFKPLCSETNEEKLLIKQ